MSFQSLLAQLQNDLGNLKTENRQLSFKYWLEIFPDSCSGQVLLNERLSGLDGGEGDFIILQGDKRQVPFRIRREQIKGDIWTFLTDTLMEEKLVGLKIIFRVEDKMGLLKERDQTIVTLETEISEVIYHRNKISEVQLHVFHTLRDHLSRTLA